MCIICEEKGVVGIDLLGMAILKDTYEKVFLDLICKSCGEVKSVNMLHYCWACWDRMCREDGNMIKAGKKELVHSVNLVTGKPSLQSLPCPYEMEHGKRVPDEFREKKVL